MPDKPQAPFASVIVPVYDDPVRVRRCLAALEHQTYPSDRYEVLVVDNGSSVPLSLPDGAFPHARVLLEPEAGINRARAMGVKHAAGEVLAFTDADCDPDPGWLEAGVTRFTETRNCGLVGGRILVVPQGNEPRTVAERLSMATHLNQERFLARGHWAAFANAFTSRRVIDQVGGLNPDLMSSGEVAWGHRVHSAGLAQVYAPAALVRHPARTSVRSLFWRTIRLEHGWSQLRDREGVGRGLRHWLGQYLLRPIVDAASDIGAAEGPTAAQRVQMFALACGLVLVRVAAYLLHKAGLRPSVRKHWG